MLTQRSNYHRTPLPNVGAIVRLPDREASGRRKRLYRVEAYNLCDAANYRGRYMSLGIHLVHLSALDNGERTQLAGHYCEEVPATMPERMPLGSRANVFGSGPVHRHRFEFQYERGKDRLHRCATCGDCITVTPQSYKVRSVSLALTAKERKALQARPIVFTPSPTFAGNPKAMTVTLERAGFVLASPLPDNRVRVTLTHSVFPSWPCQAVDAKTGKLVKRFKSWDAAEKWMVRHAA